MSTTLSSSLEANWSVLKENPETKMKYDSVTGNVYFWIFKIKYYFDWILLIKSPLPIEKLNCSRKAAITINIDNLNDGSRVMFVVGSHNLN